MAFCERLFEAEGLSSKGSGANQHYNLKSEENDFFYPASADNSLFQQPTPAYYAPFYPTDMVQEFGNNGLKKVISALLNKLPDYLVSGHTQSSWCGLAPNPNGEATRVSWKNAKALYVEKSSSIRVLQSVLFSSDGRTKLILLDLFNLLKDYADLIGYAYSTEQLIADSKFDVIHFAPWIGFPFQFSMEKSYFAGFVGYHPLYYDQCNRGIDELVVSYDAINSKGSGISVLPFDISAKKAVDNDSVHFTCATRVVLGCEQERNNTTQRYQEIIFKEMTTVGTHTENPCGTLKKVTFPLQMKGPVPYLWLIVQSNEDQDNNGRWTKFCDDYGLDYIKSLGFIFNTTVRDDAFPVVFYRSIKGIEQFKHNGNLFVYKVHFDATSLVDFVGHEIVSNFESMQFCAWVKPHPNVSLNFTVQAAIYQGVYLKKHGTGRVWGN